MSELIKTDEELAELQAEEPQDQVEPEEAELETGFELEIVDPSLYGGAKPPELVAAEARLAELEALQKSQKSADTKDEALAATLASVKLLQEQLAGGISVKQEPAPKGGPEFDLEGHREKYRKNIYTDPAKQTEEFIAPYLMELKNEITGNKTESTKNASMNKLLLNDSQRAFYQKYQKEVEAVVAKSDITSDVYQRAVSQVKSQDAVLDDLIAEKVAEKVAELQTPTSSPPPLTNIGKPSAPHVRQTTQITPGMSRWIHEMEMKGNGDRAWLINRAKQYKAEGRIPD